MRRATLKDIAAIAEVSTATVARVIHNNGYVAPETRKLVERAISETGYQINAIAQGLRRQRTYTVGHIMNSVIPNQFFAAVAEGVEEISSRHDCGVLMVTTHGHADREHRAVETLIQRRVDAIIFTTATHVDNVRLAVESGLPVVQVERMTSVETPVVTGDNYGGARRAVEHLIQLGHRRISFIGVDSNVVRGRSGSVKNPDVEQERLSGYLHALSSCDIAIDQNLIGLETGYTNQPDTRQNRGYALMQQMLDLENRPTALFATFDLFAAGALQAIYERRLRVPDEISVVGFDDTYAPYLTPPLTSVQNPTLEMGRIAARLVFQKLEGESEGSMASSYRLPMGLNVRGSTAPPQNGVST